MTRGQGFFDRAFRSDHRVRLYDEDPDLFEGIPRSAGVDAQVQVIGRAIPLEPGIWEPHDVCDPENCLGLLVLDGLIVHGVMVGDDPRSELVGPGDVVRPWEHEDDGASVSFESRWQVVDAARIVVLDAQFVAFACRWPRLMVAVASRLARRSRSLTIQLAIGDRRRVEDRLLLFFWHLADRWGRVCRDGVVVPLPVTHDVLAQLVGAQRPTVTSALRRLAADGALRRRPDRSWLLRPDPPEPTGELRVSATA